MIASLYVFLIGANSSIENPKEEVKLATSVIKVSTPLFCLCFSFVISHFASFWIPCTYPAQDNINFRNSESLNLHTQATAYAKLAESAAVKTGSLKSSAEKESLNDENGLFTILPISAESTGMLPKRKGNDLWNYNT